MLARLAAAVALVAGPAFAWDPSEVEVDVELVLAVDVSRSVSPRELEIQRRGYAEAITSPEVMEAVRRGLIGRIAITYVEWAGAWSQRTVMDWTMIETEDDAHAFADALTARFDSTLRRTSISSALTYSATLFEGNGYAGIRRVIDVSGDGPNNAGPPVVPARDAVLAQGIVINGLPLMTRDGMGSQWHLEDLDAYYRACVIGGPGAFVVPVTDWSQFAEAVRRKLVMELVDAGPLQVQSGPAPAYDCLIGEKIWDRNRRYWEGP